MHRLYFEWCIYGKILAKITVFINFRGCIPELQAYNGASPSVRWFIGWGTWVAARSSQAAGAGRGLGRDSATMDLTRGGADQSRAAPWLEVEVGLHLIVRRPRARFYRESAIQWPGRPHHTNRRGKSTKGRKAPHLPSRIRRWAGS